METLFENKCSYSKENLLEMAKKTRPIALRITYFIFIIFFAVIIINRFIKQDYLIIIAPLLLIAFFIYVDLSFPHRYVKGVLKKYYEIYHSEVQTTYLFHDDHFINIVEQSGGATRTDYIQIIKVKQTKGLYLLMILQHLVFLVDKNGFTKGNRATLKAFIKEKAIKARIKL